MGKKKGKGGKGKGKDQTRVKQTITALEKAILQSQIGTLERKIERKREQIRVLGEERDVYVEKQIEECNEKENIVQALEFAIAKATEIKRHDRQVLAELEDRQKIELKYLENEFTSVQSEIIAVSNTMKAENLILTQKLDALERFKTEVHMINASITQAEENLVEESDRFKKDANSETKQARFLVSYIRQQLVPLLSEMAELVQKHTTKLLDPAYTDAIKESIRINDFVKKLSHRVEDIEEENASLEDKLHSLKCDHKIKLEYAKEKTIQFKVQLKLISLLRQKQQERSKEISLMQELKGRTQTAAKSAYKLEFRIAAVKESLQNLRQQLRSNESVIRKLEESRSYEDDIFKKIICTVLNVRRFIKEELLISLEAFPKEDLTLLEKVYVVLTEAIDNPSLEKDISSVKAELVTYKTGDLGILYATKSSLQNVPQQLDMSVQTDEDGFWDVVSAGILSDVSLINKFERKTLKAKPKN